MIPSKMQIYSWIQINCMLMAKLRWDLRTGAMMANSWHTASKKAAQTGKLSMSKMLKLVKTLKMMN
jgi:hypothetical protein